MRDHRIRLTDQDLDVICSALRARVAMTRGVRRHETLRLLERLSDIGRGNPQLRFNVVTQRKAG